MIVGLQGVMTELQNLSLDEVNALWTDPLRRKNRLPFFFFHPNDDVATTKIVKIVGKSADGMQHRLRVPTRFVLNALTFHGALTK